MNATIALLQQQTNDKTLATNAFYAAWANATLLQVRIGSCGTGINFVFQPPPNVGNWTGMLVSGNQTVPSGISLASAQLLFDSAQVCCMHYCGQ